MPVFWKPLVIFVALKARSYGFRQSSAIWWIEIRLPGFKLSQSLNAVLSAFLNCPKTLTSRGCSLWEQCGGNVSIVMPLSLAKLITDKSRWLEWLSSSKRWGVSLEQPVHLKKCFKLSRNFSALIHPYEWARPLTMLPVCLFFKPLVIFFRRILADLKKVTQLQLSDRCNIESLVTQVTNALRLFVRGITFSIRSAENQIHCHKKDPE